MFYRQLSARALTYFFLDFMDVSAIKGMQLFAEEVMKKM
jgi:hypothetical protein